MKYLLLIAIAMVACSFTICDRIVKEVDGWKMFVYPDREDSTTYLKQVYLIRKPYKERNKKGKWIRFAGEYSIDEEFYLHGTLLSSSHHSFRHDHSFLNTAVYYGHGVRESFKVQFDKFRWIHTEEYDIEVDYYDNGTFKDIKIITWPKNEHRQIATSMEWNRSHDTKWIGSSKFVFKQKQDSVFTEDELTAQISTVIVSHDSILKKGWWKKYNVNNEVVDSIYYPDPKY